ncbi:MAG: hypothetical protein HKP58_11585 [Desulfatitalea sp.]|nr:hypothetical protein [Desulfatitalea sp.]
MGLYVRSRHAFHHQLELRERNPETETVYIELSCSDTGQGIGAEAINKIFDPFFTTKKKGKGTGMGLAITYGIVKEYGGIITVDSQLGKGSTFKVYIPRIREETAPVSICEAIVPTGKEMH